MLHVVNAALAGALFLCATPLLVPPLSSREHGVPEDSTVAPGEDAHDMQAREVLSALQAGDFSGVGARFNARMRAAVSDEQLGQVWQGILASQGPLKGAEVVERRDAQGMAVRGLRLHFELSDTLLQVAFEPDGRRIAGLLIRPAAAAEASSSQAPTHAPYVDTAAFRAEAVSFGKAPYMLSGTLTVPATGTPAPAVVLLHGSGPN